MSFAVFLAYFGLIWLIVNRFGSALGQFTFHFGPWLVLTCLWLFQVILGHFGSFLFLFWIVFGQFGSVWVSLGLIFGRFGFFSFI